MRSLFIALFCGAVTLAPVSSLSARTWTDMAGRQIQAKFVRVVGDQVVLERAGRPLTIPLSTLSAQDQQYIQSQTSGNKTTSSGITPSVIGEPEPDSNAGTPQSSGNTWTDRSGNQVTASLISFDGTTAILETPDGQRADFPLVNFSDADQQRLLSGPRTPQPGVQPEPNNPANPAMPPVVTDPNIPGLPAGGSPSGTVIAPSSPYGSGAPSHPNVPGATPGSLNPGQLGSVPRATMPNTPSHPGIPGSSVPAHPHVPGSNVPGVTSRPARTPGSSYSSPTPTPSEIRRNQAIAAYTTPPTYTPPTYSPPSYTPPSYDTASYTPPVASYTPPPPAPTSSSYSEPESSSSGSSRVRVSGRSVRGLWKLILLVVGLIGGFFTWLQSKTVG